MKDLKKAVQYGGKTRCKPGVHSMKTGIKDASKTHQRRLGTSL